MPPLIELICVPYAVWIIKVALHLGTPGLPPLMRWKGQGHQGLDRMMGLPGERDAARACACSVFSRGEGSMHVRLTGGGGSGQPVAADGKSLVTFNASLTVSKIGVNSQQASNVPAQLRPGAREWNAAQHAS